MSRPAPRVPTVALAVLPAVAHVSPDAASTGPVTGAYVLRGAGPVTRLAGLVLSLGARWRRATVEQPARETVPTGAQ